MTSKANGRLTLALIGPALAALRAAGSGDGRRCP